MGYGNKHRTEDDRARLTYRQEKEEERITVEHISLLLGEMSDVEQSTDNETENN
jgi:hypothetical protein